MAAALSLPDGPNDQVHWRCSSNEVLACNANHGAACDLTPTVELMLAYCGTHPDAQNIPAGPFRVLRARHRPALRLLDSVVQGANPVAAIHLLHPAA